MGEQILARLIQSYTPDAIVITRKNKIRGEAIAQKYGVTYSSSNSTAVTNAQIIFLCIKPQDFKGVLLEIAPHVAAPIIISIAAAISQSYIMSQIPRAVVLRYMPSPLIAERKGVALLVRDKQNGQRTKQIISQLNAWSSMLQTIPDKDMHIYTVLASCGSAFVAALLLKIFAVIGDSPTHKKILTKVINDTIISLVKKPTVQWRKMVAHASTPGGVTAKGIQVINSKATTFLIKKVIRNAVRQSQRIQKKSEQ